MASYTVFTRQKRGSRKVKMVSTGLTLAQARKMCEASNAPCLDKWFEFTTDENYKASWGKR